MFKTTSILGILLFALVFTGAMVVVEPLPAAAQTAERLDCRGCVKSKQLKNNGIKSKDIKDGNVTNADLGTNAVSSAKVQDDSLTGADIQDGSIGGADIASDSIPATDLSNEAGADFAGGSQSETLVDADIVYRSVEITAPSDGVVIVNASGTMLFTTAAAGARCSITTGTTRDGENRIFVGKPDTAPTAPGIAFAGTRGFNVAAGTTTFNLVCDRGFGTVSINDTYMTAAFYPMTY